MRHPPAAGSPRRPRPRARPGQARGNSRSARSGAFASALAITASSAGGSSGRSVLAAGGSASRCANTTATRSRAGTVAVQPGTRTARSRASRRPPARRSPLPRSARGRRSRCAQQLAVAAKSGLVGDPPSEPEVREVDVVGAVRSRTQVEEHVGGLHVTMHETARVRGVQGTRHLSDDADRVRGVQPAASAGARSGRGPRRSAWR